MWATEKVAWCSYMEIRCYFNTKYFIINSKIIALCNCKHSAMLAYIHTQVTLQSRVDAGRTHIHTPMPTLDLT